MVDARSIPVVNTHLVLLQLHCQQSPVEYCQLTRPFLSVKGLAGETTGSVCKRQFLVVTVGVLDVKSLVEHDGEG